MIILQNGNSCNQKIPTEHDSPTKVYRVQQAGPKERVDGKVKSYAQTALQLYNAGFEPVPIAPRKKYPTLKGWSTIQLPILLWPKSHGIGLRTGKLSAIDIDVYSPREVDDLLHCFEGLEIITRVGMAPKTLIPILCPEVAGKIISNKWRDSEGRINQIEILSYGQQFVAHGVHPDTKRPYEWSGDLLSHELSVIPMQFIDHLFSRLDQLAIKAGWKNISVIESKPRIRKSRNKSGNKPGDLYNRACKIQDVLEEYGWTHWRGDYWTRPGKKHGISGTVFDDNTFWCFTSSTCLIPDRTYDCFGLMAFYEFDGDFAAAAKALKEVA